MLNRRSWLSRATASTQRLLSDSTHELPRWRTPSPMRASMIPPPIVESTYMSSPSLSAVGPVVVEQPSEVRDRQSELEADLQFLLDAQAEGLIRGLEGGVPDDQTSTGSTTPTAQSVRSASARRATRPVRKKPGLRSARKGIYNSIQALSAVKDEELQTIDGEVQEKSDTIAQIGEWEKKRTGLQKAAKRVDDGEETVRAQRMRQEADILQDEINTVELQLADMNGRHRKLVKQVAALENSVQAKLASYTSSLSLLEQDVEKFLSTDPTDCSSRRSLPEGRQSMWALPAERRTLGLAREHWTDDRDSMLEQQRGVEREKQALDDGATMWKEVVVQVTEFEKRLRAEMAGLSDMSLSSQSAWDDPPPSQQDSIDRLKELIHKLDTVLEDLESKYILAEERDWKLLIAAIGAELDALRKGKRILESLLPHTDAHDQHHDEQAERNGLEIDLPLHDGSEIHQLDSSFQTARPSQRSPRVNASDSDDDPEPELLFTRQNFEQD